MGYNGIFPIPPEAKEAFRKFAEQSTGWEVKDTNIKKIIVSKFSERSKKVVVADICVGENLPHNLADTSEEPVLAIFESQAYLVITPTRGGLIKKKDAWGERLEGPYLFGYEQVLGVEKG